MRKILLMCLLFSSCRNDDITTRAKITERRSIDSARLMLHYVYDAGGREFYDSVILENKVIAHDSITIVYSRRNPEKSRLQTGE